MTVAAKNDNRTSLVVPTAVRRMAGFKSGQELEFKASDGVITIVPRVLGGREEERRRIDAQLAKSRRDIKDGRVSGAFNTDDEMAASIEASIKKLEAKKPKPRP